MPTAPTKTMRSIAHGALQEVGLVSLHTAGADVKLLCAQRFVRLFAYGASTLVLASFLRELDISPTRIGLFMTLTLAGDVAISFVLALFADGVGRRAVLALGALLMAASGLVFALSSNYYVLLCASIFGVISPGGNEIGPFRAVEESTIAHLTGKAKRSDIYAWYNLLGSAGAAFGIISCGWATDIIHRHHDKSLVDVYRLVFYAYAALGLVKAALVSLLSSAVEAEPSTRSTANTPTGNASERDPLLQNSQDEQDASRGTSRWRLFSVSNGESIRVVLILCVLFGLDSFASGLVPLSWVTFFFRSRYDLSEGKLGSIFFVTSLIAAASALVAASLARRFGNIKTMVFTHLPSAVFLALIPLRNEVHWSTIFLVLRSCIQSMDVAPRSAFLAAILLPQERTKSMGLINVFKTTAQSLGPLLTGVLADLNLFWAAFVCAGGLKASYDLGLLAVFVNHERQREDHGAAHEEGQNDASG